MLLQYIRRLRKSIAIFFETQGIHEVTALKTAWDYFTHDKPGESFLYEYEGKNVYDMVEYLKRYGLYFAERREN